MLKISKKINLKNFKVTEYGLITYIEKDNNPELVDNKNLKEILIPKSDFDDLYKYIDKQNQNNSDIDKIADLSKKNNKRIIRTKNQVGVIETPNGVSLEILPKIYYSDSNIDEYRESKNIFFNMLKELKLTPFSTLNTAHLQNSNLPILEVFIQTYINEVEKILIKGIKSDYINYENNLVFLKGKLKISDNIKYNISNSSKFYVEYQEYSENIILNKIIKTTLFKLKSISNDINNISKISKLMNIFSSIDLCTDILNDLQHANINNKLISHYKTVIEWSNIFLTNKAFVNFSGDFNNKAILFPMEKVFEDYITSLFKKHPGNLYFKSQDKSQFLVKSHRAQPMFRLRPDIVSRDEQNKFNEINIIDMKWKELKIDKTNYGIQISDMYQMYTYGIKYSNSLYNRINLILIYPKTLNFKEPLEPFILEENIKLFVFPFDLSNKNKQQEINKIKSFID